MNSCKWLPYATSASKVGGDGSKNTSHLPENPKIMWASYIEASRNRQTLLLGAAFGVHFLYPAESPPGRISAREVGQVDFAPERLFTLLVLRFHALVLFDLQFTLQGDTSRCLNYPVDFKT